MTQSTAYYSDYPTEPIGGGNPYYRCKCCKRSVPEINGALEKHEVTCSYRIKKEAAIKPTPTFWHAPGIGEVHSSGHTQMIYCEEEAEDEDSPFIASNSLAKEVSDALNMVA